MYKECICIDCFIHWTRAWDLQSTYIDEWTQHTWRLLVLTLLALTVACCYARPAEHAHEPSWASWQSSHPETAEHSQHPAYPGKWLNDTVIQLQCINASMLQKWWNGSQYMDCCHTIKNNRGHSFGQFDRCFECPKELPDWPVTSFGLWLNRVSLLYVLMYVLKTYG